MAQREESIQRGMVVFAHPDDAEWGCSGTVAKWCAEGWEVVYIVCTDGSKGSNDPEMSGPKLVEIRQREQRNAGKVLGLLDGVFLGYEDSLVEATLDLRRDIAREIRRYKPDILICGSPLRRLNHNGYLGHPDHMASGEAAMSAVFPSARDRLTFPELLEQGLEPHKVRELWITDHEEPDNYVDVTPYVDVAIQALKQHESQVSGEDIGKYWKQWRDKDGSKVGFEYAEAFKRFELG